MKPLKLTMQAFGPYANKQEIDFTQLGNKTMFVISGATGAGKTTIFDGISFAIYGKASGDDRNGIDLRSQFANDETLTEVSLAFELRGKNYLIIRSPQQEKKKSRGEGTTTQGAKAELYEIGETETLLASNVREVDEKIAEIIKIDCNQFRQIMMIPQGEFRKLLISESKDKEKILQKLFHTEHYKMIEDKLKEKASELKKTVEQSIMERSNYIGRIQIDSNDEQLSQLIKAEHLNIPELIAELEKNISEERTKLTEIATNISTKDDYRTMIQKQIHQGNELLEQLDKKEKLSAQKAELEERIPSINQQVEAIQLAKKAQIIERLEQLLIENTNQVESKVEELKKAETQIDLLQKKLAEKQAILEEEVSKKDQHEVCQKEISRLANLEKDVLSFSSVEKEVNGLHLMLEKLKSNKATIEKKLKLHEEKLASLNSEKEAIQEARMQQSELSLTLTNEERALEKVSDLLKNKKQLIALEKVYSASEDEKKDIEEDLKEKTEELNNLHEAWNKGQAGILAEKLIDEIPCPVCGSNHHPNKATIAEDMPTEEQLKAIQNEVKELEQSKQKIDAKYYEAKSKFETQMERVIALADEVNVLLPYKLRSFYSLEDIEEYYQAQITKGRNEIKELEAKIAKASKIEAEIESIKVENAKQSELLHKLNDDYENNYTIYVEKRRDLTRLSETLPENMRDEAAFRNTLQKEKEKLLIMEKALQIAEKEVQEVKQQMASTEGTISSLQKVVEEVKARENQLQLGFEKKLAELEFNSVEEYKKVKRSEIEIKNIESDIQAFREELRSVTDRYEELALRLDKAEKPNLNELNDKLQEISAEINLLQERRNVLYHKVKTNTDIKDAIVKINANIQVVENEYKTVGELADIASGRNTFRVTFERYVLAAFLDEILIAANARLNKMTNGRYQLQRKTDRSKGNAQSGLELLAFDQYTGSTRHVKTLSGGESFKASLALALGLADIVQSFAGGVSMETMFIDEGFGTLDPESLETAIETLIEIQSTGRLVGVISHVPELKERIDARFEVMASQSGSTVIYHGDSMSM